MLITYIQSIVLIWYDAHKKSMKTNINVQVTTALNDENSGPTVGTFDALVSFDFWGINVCEIIKRGIIAECS